MSAVPEGTVQDVLCWVDDDPDRADQALQAEYAGANRSTLISQLEAIATREATPVTETTTADPGYDEETGLAPGPEVPEVAVDPEDEATTVLPLTILRSDAEVDPEVQIPIEGTPVDTLTGVVAPHGFMLVINGEAFAFTPDGVAALRAVCNHAIAGVTL